MIKECEVILNNSAVTVVKFDDNLVQFPAICKNAETVIVEYKDEEYKIVDEDKPKKKATKVTD